MTEIDSFLSRFDINFNNIYRSEAVSRFSVLSPDLEMIFFEDSYLPAKNPLKCNLRVMRKVTPYLELPNRIFFTKYSMKIRFYFYPVPFKRE